MERLTLWTDKGAALKLNAPMSEQEARGQLIEKYKLAINKLAAYEDTGLEPEETEKLKVENARLSAKLNEAIEDLSGYCDTCALINTCKNHKPSKGLKWWTNCQDWQWRRLEV